MKITPQRSRGFQANVVSWSTSSSTSSGTITVNFSPAFAAMPSFTCQVVSPAGAAIRATIRVISVTASQAQLTVDLNASATTSGTVHWTANEI
ncbi:hypothetical protein ABZ783_07075 [Micromonospora sp. NPDC047738]|uniref:hypothetical protein n=1 Tax=Micromonospora sp. NPDC047738 TaxID=3155741 RepID=UPI00340A69D5